MQKQTIAEAAHDACHGDNESLWLACWEIAGRDGYRSDPKPTNQEMCERAIRSMSPQQRALYFEERT